MEGRIQELEEILRNAVIIDNLKQEKNIVNIGSNVTIQEAGFEPETYYMVGPKEANPHSGRISHESPIGKALLGHSEGEIVNAETPTGIIRFKIIKIE